MSFRRVSYLAYKLLPFNNFNITQNSVHTALILHSGTHPLRGEAKIQYKVQILHFVGNR